MTITVLIENHEDREGRGLAHEHGLALLVDVESGTFLFDTGASERFIENAAQLGRPVTDVSHAMISHGHRDHGGGLRAFLEANRGARVSVSRGLFDGHYARLEDGSYRDIGLDRDLLAANRDRFVLVDAPVEMLPGVLLVTGITGPHPRPADTRRFFLRAGSSYQPDLFCHEMMAVVRERSGITILAGCSHPGIVNIVETAERLFPGERINALIGGFHLPDPGPGRAVEPEAGLVRIGRLLAAREGLRVWTGHCTGERACSILARELGERLSILSTGGVIRDR